MRLIDADAFEIDVQKEWENNNISNSEWMDIRQWLKDAPTIEDEHVKHGKWIKENIVLTSLPPQSRWHCSVCGSIRDGYDESVLTPYCPNCGAKMLPPTQADDGVR